MQHTSTSLVFNADSFANRTERVNADAVLAAKRAIELRTAVSEMDELLESRGLRVDCRAKCASGKILYWARVLGPSGREIASSLGWYQQEEDARLHALSMLQMVDAEVGSLSQI